MLLYTPLVEQLKLDVRMNPRNRCVEIKTSKHTSDIDHLQNAADFCRAYMLGFAVAGTALTVFPRLASGDIRGRLAWCSSLFGVTIIAAHLLISAI